MRSSVAGAGAFIHCLLVAAAVFAADRITKYLIGVFIPVGGAVPGRDSFVKFLHVLNDGVAFSMFQGHRTPLIVLQSVLVAVIVVFMLIAYRRLIRRLPNGLTVMTAFSLMLGGGLGNLWDRVSTGLVTDFISIGSFAVFNTADACLVAGCGLLILCMLRYKDPDAVAGKGSAADVIESGGRAEETIAAGDAADGDGTR
ncbi:MAG: signal peptidase II [Clostridiales Family XIII bacterium]|jgi:signal peptidase II|nr:signal peptidase II [Clostridiales Family XIII bacterium]